MQTSILSWSLKESKAKNPTGKSADSKPECGSRLSDRRSHDQHKLQESLRNPAEYLQKPSGILQGSFQLGAPTLMAPPEVLSLKPAASTCRITSSMPPLQSGIGLVFQLQYYIIECQHEMVSLTRRPPLAASPPRCRPCRAAQFRFSTREYPLLHRSVFLNSAASTCRVTSSTPPLRRSASFASNHWVSLIEGQFVGSPL